MKKKSHAFHYELDQFTHDVGLLNKVLTDGTKELHLGQLGTICKKNKIHMQTTEPNSP